MRGSVWLPIIDRVLSRFRSVALLKRQLGDRRISALKIGMEGSIKLFGGPKVFPLSFRLSKDILIVEKEDRKSVV